MMWGVSQWVVSVIVIAEVVLPPFLRMAMIAGGGKGFIPWGEYVGGHIARSVSFVAIAAALYFGGFLS